MEKDALALFWSSVVLTGDPTVSTVQIDFSPFWSSVVLTGDPTRDAVA